MERTQDFDVDVDELWRAVADPDGLGDWLGEEADVDLRPGGEGTVVDDGELRHLLIEVVEPHRLTFSWWPDTDRADRSHVELVVEPTAEGSRLRVRETRLEVRHVRHTGRSSAHGSVPPRALALAGV